MGMETFASEMASLHNGRDLAAWIELPRQFSSGGKERLGRNSKAGQAHIRQTLIIGAMSQLNCMGRKAIRESSMAGAHGGPQTAHVGHHRTSRQNGVPDLGHADKERRLQESDAGIPGYPGRLDGKGARRRRPFGKIIEQIRIRKTSSGRGMIKRANEIST